MLPPQMAPWLYSISILKSWKASLPIPCKSSTCRSLDLSHHHSRKGFPITFPLMPQTLLPPELHPPLLLARLLHHPLHSHRKQASAASTAYMVAVKLSTSLWRKEVK